MELSQVVLLVVVDALMLGCADSGFDLEFAMPVTVEKIELTIDEESGAEPQYMGNNTYRIQLDENGRASIPDPWPIHRFHRTFIVTPLGRMRQNDDFRLGESRWTKRYQSERVNGYVVSKSVVDGSKLTIPIIEWTELPDKKPSDSPGGDGLR